MTAVVRFLNQPTVKESIKNLTSATALAFGFVGAYDIYQILQGQEVSTEIDLRSPKWIQSANKAIVLCAKISLVLSAATSRPAVFTISRTVGRLFSSEQLECAFGPNTIFELNPWHPRHIVSIAAEALARPFIVQSIYRRVYGYFAQHHNLQNVWLTNSKLFSMTLINMIASRPTQHLYNQYLSNIFRH